MKKQQKLFAAEVAGNMAFKSGIKRIPCLDSNIMNLLNSAIGSGNDKIMKAWLRGWDTANLNAQPTTTQEEMKNEG